MEIGGTFSIQDFVGISPQDRIWLFCLTVAFKPIKHSLSKSKPYWADFNAASTSAISSSVRCAQSPGLCRLWPLLCNFMPMNSILCNLVTVKPNACIIFLICLLRPSTIVIWQLHGPILSTIAGLVFAINVFSSIDLPFLCATVLIVIPS